MARTFSLDDLTMRELVDLSEVAGVNFADLTPNGKGEASVTPRMLAALVWIERRREDPTFTFEDALNLPVSAMTLGQGRGKATPSAPRSSGSSPRSASRSA